MLLEYTKIVAIGANAETVAATIRSLDMGLEIATDQCPIAPEGALYVISQADWDDAWNEYCVEQFISPVVVDPSDHGATKRFIEACL